MDKSKASVLISNLLERLTIDPVTGKYKLEGVLTKNEVDALATLAGIKPLLPLVDKKNAQFSINHGSGIPPSIDLNLECLDSNSEQSELFCIDFGTAYSKAAVWNEDSQHPLPLDLAKASQGRSGYTVESSLYLTDERIWFGPAAIDACDRDGDFNRKRFDSPKEYLSLGDHADLFSKAEIEVDPSQSFANSDLIILYIAYLTALTNQQLSTNDYGHCLKRRFAVPSWQSTQVESVSKVLGQFLIDAQILADSLPVTSWSNGLSIADARKWLDAVNAVDHARKKNASFIGGHVLEPAAAASGITDHFENLRTNALIIDIGAGTSDFGVYHYVLPGDGRPIKIAPFKNGTSALKIAGNRLDDILLQYTRKKMGIDGDSHQSKMVGRVLSRNKRRYKRELFDTDSVNIEIEDYHNVSISIDEFLKYDLVRDFSLKIKERAESVLLDAGPQNFLQSKFKNFVILTGGGASLPMVRDIFDKPLSVGDTSIKFHLADVTPSWVNEFGSDVETIVPQLAVSLGGCSQNIPDETHPISDISDPGETVFGPIYKN